MKSKHFQIPESQDKFLTEILGSIKKRSKSLNYNTEGLCVERVFEVYEEERVEKIEIKLTVNRADLLVSVWQDRWVIVSCGIRTKESKWDWSFQGKYLPCFDGKEMIKAIEKTFVNFYQMNEKRTSTFEIIWKPLLARKLEVIK